MSLWCHELLFFVHVLVNVTPQHPKEDMRCRRRFAVASSIADLNCLCRTHVSSLLLVARNVRGSGGTVWLHIRYGVCIIAAGEALQ